jgi:hypothetical protein
VALTLLRVNKENAKCCGHYRHYSHNPAFGTGMDLICPKRLIADYPHLAASVKYLYRVESKSPNLGNSIPLLAGQLMFLKFGAIMVLLGCTWNPLGSRRISTTNRSSLSRLADLIRTM